ncbi:hypothetical protein K504DRAFT_473701 [Pleomassaria siparia CBS 279.74]|uniref:Cenp-O kinetochore centromere component n=1 Tax=Pleomassaria siparia CBS 279.74 TaxID=1314801 RepID=A0A6G1JUU0_9PLEO|nr:hypothetical protein K504DRAFT_473701 [Pleomassaria siparia CBS 279.74]
MDTIESLDSDISDIRAQIASLKARRANLSSIVLSLPHLSTHISQGRVADEPQRALALKRIAAQQRRITENTYRACAGATAYKVRDPDPHAVNNGHILGVRIEVAIRGRFIETYHVHFNRPNPRYKLMLKIHHHTIPSCIPLQALRNKWLPVTDKDKSVMVEQKLIEFGKTLRRELVAWHLRTEAVDKLRVEAGLGDKGTREKEERETAVMGKVLNAFVSSDDEDEDEDDVDQDAESQRRNAHEKIIDVDADMGVREISIAWSNGLTGVFGVTKDGNIDKAAVTTSGGVRVPEVARRALGRIEGLVQRLTA